MFFIVPKNRPTQPKTGKVGHYKDNGPFPAANTRVYFTLSIPIQQQQQCVHFLISTLIVNLRFNYDGYLIMRLYP